VRIFPENFPKGTSGDLPEIFSQSFLQKVAGYSFGRIYHATNRNDYPKNTLNLKGSQGEIYLPQLPHFSVKIADFHLNQCILKETPKTQLREATFNLAPFQSPSPRHPSGLKFMEASSKE
jgi:hypothetical protein